MARAKKVRSQSKTATAENHIENDEFVNELQSQKLRLVDFIESHSVDHIPVLFEPVLVSLLQMRPDRPVIVDATLGEAGHSRGMLRLVPNATIIGIDRDPFMIERAKSRLQKDGFVIADRPQTGAVHIVNAGFDSIQEVLLSLSLQADFVLADFGVSVHHFATADRGFSFRDSVLDMRLDPALPVTASDIVNRYSADDLSTLLLQYGQERLARQIAASIVAARPIHSASALTDAVLSALIRDRNRRKIRRFITDQDAARVFQALRIKVNGELQQIESFVGQIPEILADGGRAALISFHSLEDRLVKVGFQSLRNAGFRILTKKAIEPTDAEVALNPKSRSAKLRIIEKSAEAV